MRLRILLPVLLLGVFSATAPGVTVEGVSVPPTRTVAGQSLPLNGAGVRVFSLLMVPVKVYVAAFYAPVPLRSSQAAMAAAAPLRWEFTFLRGVPQDQVAQAWRAQFDASATVQYPGYEADRDRFIALFGPLSKGGTQEVTFVGDQTVVSENGRRKGVVDGRNFQRAFLSMWFGERPVTSDLKTSLLGGNSDS